MTKYVSQYTGAEIDAGIEKANAAILVAKQNLAEAQKAQARGNIGAASANQFETLNEEKVNKSGLTLGVHTDGLVYIFIDGAPHGNGLEITANVIEGDVFGYVDENNTIVLNGNLADGDYSVKYEMADGSTVEIGDLVLDTNEYYSVTNDLTNCTSNNSATRAVKGGSYSAVISADSGYELSSVAVKMGGQAVSVSGGVIDITSVTGDIVITALAEELTTDEPENVLKTVGYVTGRRIKSSNGAEDTSASYAEYEATNYIPVKYGDTITLENIVLEASGSCSVALYNENKAYIAGLYMTKFIGGYGNSSGNGVDINGERASQPLTKNTWSGISESSGIAYMRFSAKEITENSIVYVTDN